MYFFSPNPVWGTVKEYCVTWGSPILFPCQCLLLVVSHCPSPCMSCKGIERLCSVVGAIWNLHFLPALLVVGERERDGWRWVEWANGNLLQRGTDAFIFLSSVGRRRNTVFLFQCERLCFRFDIQNRSLAKAKVKPGSKFLGRVMGLLEVFNKRLDGYQEW